MLLCQLAFQAQTGPAFADNLHLITKKSKRQYKVYRQYPGQHEAGYIYTTVVQTTRDRLHIYPRNSAVDENRVDRKCNHIAYRDITSGCIHDHGVHTDLT